MKTSLFQILLATLLACAAHAQTPADEKLVYYRSVLDQGLRDNDPKQIAEGYYLMGKYEERMNNFTEAYRLYRQALTINEKIGNPEKPGRLYVRIAALELKQKNFEKAKQYAHEAIRIASQYDLEKGLASAYMQMGIVYLESARKSDSALAVSSLDSALFYFNKTEVRASLEKNEYELAKSRFRLGLLYREKKDKKAIENLSYAAKISKTQIQNEAVAYHSVLALTLIEFGSLFEAQKVLSECQDLIDNDIRRIPSHEAYYYFVYSKCYEAMKEWREAVNLNEKAITTFSQIDAHESKTGFQANLHSDIKAQQKNLAQKIHSIETKNKERIIVILIAVFIALILLSWFLYRNYQKQKSLTLKNEFLIREQYHRVKNNLQVISSMLSLQHDHLTDEASKATLSESQTRINSMMLLHRQLYENDNVELIDIGAFFQEIINSVALTFGINDFRVRLDIGEEFLETDTATSIGAVVNELAMNSFKHAFVNTEPLIELSTRKTSDTIEIMYKDSGNTNIGTVFDNPGKQGFGLALIEMILYQINGKMKYRFENGSVFTITFKP